MLNAGLIAWHGLFPEICLEDIPKRTRYFFLRNSGPVSDIATAIAALKMRIWDRIVFH
jgi:hypothetical protein